MNNKQNSVSSQKSEVRSWLAKVRQPRKRNSPRASALVFVLTASCLLPPAFSVAGFRSRRRRLADVGWHPRSQHDFQHEGTAHQLGREDEEERQVGGASWVRKPTAMSWSPAARFSSAPTTRRALRDPKITGDKGVLMAFRESDGQFMWQMVHDKLVAGRVNDWPYQGVASSPLVEGDRLYYVSNRAELMCLDTQGFRDKENDGPVTDEKLKGEFERRRRLALRHDRRGRLAAAQPGELIAGVVWRSDLCQHLEWSGRESRQCSFAESAGDHCRQQENRKACLGRQLRQRTHPARSMVLADSGDDRRRGPGDSWPGRRLDSRLRSADRQEALGV